MLSRIRDLIYSQFNSQFNMHRFRSLYAPTQNRNQTILLFDRLEQFAQLLLIREFDGGRHLRGAFDIDFALVNVAQDARIAQHQSVARQLAVAFAVARKLRTQIRAHRLNCPSDVVMVQICGDLIQVFLTELPLRPNQFVPRLAARSDKHHQHAIIRQQ